MHRKEMEIIAARKKLARFIVGSGSDCYSAVEARTNPPPG
jgi:hypothetical protein